MSTAKTRRKKEKRRHLSQEARSIINKIRSGIFPRYFFAKKEEGSGQLERDAKGKLTWRLISTYRALMALPEAKK